MKVRLAFVLWLVCCSLASANLPLLAVGTSTYHYDAQRSGLPTLLTLPSAASITNRYDSLARLDYTALVNYWGHTLDGYSYGMDLLGLRTNITRNLGLTTNSVSVGYDSIGQITSWSAREGPSGPLRLNEPSSYAWDQAGNLRFLTNGGLVQAFNCDTLNQLTNVCRSNSVMTVSGATPAPATSVTVNGQSAQRYGDFTFAATNLSLVNGTNTFTIIAQNAYGLRVTNTTISYLPSSISLAWDSNGNLTNDGIRSFAYSPENQLTNVTVAGALKTDFVYDGLGRRRIESDYGWQSGNWTKTNELHFIYDGWLLVQVRDGNNNVLWTATRGLDLSGSLAGAGGIGGLLARTEGTSSAFYHADGAGNITGLMDGQQNMAARHMYDPFGRPVNQQGPMARGDAMGFSSMPQLGGLSLYAERPYSRDWLRFLTQDPLGIRAGSNPYQFVRNNPLRYIDPYGLQDVQLELDLDIEPAEPAPTRWGPGRMPEEEVLRARDELLRRAAPADMAFRQAEPEPAPAATRLGRLVNWLGNLFKPKCPAREGRINYGALDPSGGRQEFQQQ